LDTPGKNAERDSFREAGVREQIRNNSLPIKKEEC